MTNKPYETVYCISPDDFAACPVCGVRLDPDMDGDNLRIVDEDEDGPIHLGTCMEHGAFSFQFSPD